VSPISSPFDFRGNLGSAYLEDFRRDSFSAADRSPFVNVPRPTLYFDSSRTVPTGAFLGGQRYAPFDTRVDQRLDNVGGLRAGITGAPRFEIGAPRDDAPVVFTQQPVAPNSAADRTAR
jgi:hypothetical protein